MYDMPDEIQVAADGPIRIITLNRPDNLNAVNDALHTGLARLWGRLSEDYDARAAVITGAGRAFSAGGDFAYLEELSRDPVLRAKTIAHGRDLVLGLARCRVPIVAAVNGPAVGPRLQPGGAVRRRVHGDERLPVRSARVDRAGRRRRRPAGLAAADQLADGQGVRVHRREDPRRAGTGDRAWPTTSSQTRCRRRWRVPSGSAACPARRSRPPSAS